MMTSPVAPEIPSTLCQDCGGNHVMILADLDNHSCVCRCCSDVWQSWLERKLVLERIKRVQKLMSRLKENAAETGSRLSVEDSARLRDLLARLEEDEARTATKQEVSS